MFVLPDEYACPELLAQYRGNTFYWDLIGSKSVTYVKTLKKPYAIHRQMHVGDMLDELTRRGALSWRWDYRNSTAEYWITLPGKREKRFGTREAEVLAQEFANELQIIWVPVPHHGGKENWEKTVSRMEQMEEGLIPKPWES